jgi:DNA-binding transcriptional regulator YhcF (GntR family)
LHHQPEAVGIRQLARIAGIHVRSAELAVHDLVSEGLVTRRRRGNRVFCAIQRNHPDAVVLSAVFEAAARASIGANRQSLNRRAKRILPFIRQANRMIHRAKGSRHDA